MPSSPSRSASRSCAAVPPSDDLERLEREKRELQQALAILVGAAARAFAQGDPHDRRAGALRELAEATDAARDTLAATR